jgi:hypothetical protein
MRVHAEAPQEVVYLLNFVTSSREEAPTPFNFTFVTDDLLLVYPPGVDSYLLERQLMEQSQIIDLFPGMVLGGELDYRTADPTTLLNLLRSANDLHLIGRTLIVLGGQLMEGSPELNYTVDEGRWLGANQHGDLMAQFLDEHGIPFDSSAQPRNIGLGLISHSGLFTARQDGIYFSGSGQRIVENYRPPGGYYFGFAGWVYDDRGLILYRGGHYLIDIGSPLYIRAGFVNQPILLLKVPPEYLP